MKKSKTSNPPPPEVSSGSPDFPVEENTERLIEILEEETRVRERKLKFSDFLSIAAKNEISSESFYLIPNLNEVLAQIYRVNSLGFKGEVDKTKLKRQVSTLESELKSLKEEHVDISVLTDMLDGITKTYERFEKPEVSKNPKDPDRALVALFSDLHAGEVVSEEETHGINKYNSEIMKERIDIFFHRLLEFSDEVGTDVLHFKMLGDMINGEIHEELIRNSDLDTVESLIQVSDYVAQWLAEISGHFREIHVLAISGNHGRFSKKPNFKKKNTLNFDFLAYEFIRRELKDVVDTFEIPKSFFSIHEILGYKFLSLHGDVFKGGTGLNPVSGTWGRDVSKFRSLYEESGGFQYAEFAHFHTPMLDIPTFSGVSIMVNGAVKGADEFSIGAVKAGSRPSQLAYVVEAGYGVKFRTALYLDTSGGKIEES